MEIVQDIGSHSRVDFNFVAHTQYADAKEKKKKTNDLEVRAKHSGTHGHELPIGRTTSSSHG